MTTLVHRLTVAVVATLAVLAVLAAPASAGTRSDVTVTFTEKDPTWTSVAYVGCIVSTSSTAPARYREVTVEVSASGEYAVSNVFDQGQILGIFHLRRDGSCFPVNFGFGSVQLSAGTHQFLVTGSGPGTTVTARFDGPGTVSTVVELSDEEALAACAPGAAVPTGYTLRQGTTKSETVVGTPGRDLVRGLGGNDVLKGMGGDDVLCGGGGNDSLEGGEGDDRLFGEDGRDLVVGGLGDDVLRGGSDRDSLEGGLGDDDLRGGTGDDVHDGGAGTDSATDTQGKDVFRNVEVRG